MHIIKHYKKITKVVHISETTSRKSSKIKFNEVTIVRILSLRMGMVNIEKTLKGEITVLRP